MSKKLKIVTGSIPRYKVYLDDAEVADVISYSTECTLGATIATLKIHIRDSVEITRDQEKNSITEEMMERIKKEAEAFVNKDPKRYLDPELQKKIIFNNMFKAIINPQDHHTSD